jgi:hypothetical protein
MSRRALLLAIAEYDPLPRLDYVARDIPTLRRALTNAGFDPQAIEGYGAGAESRRSGLLTNTRLRASIRTFLREAREGDDMLLFLSGHGIELQGRRVILPADYDLQEPQSPMELVWDGWIVEQARTSLAQSVLVLVDACREGVHLELVADKALEAPLKLADKPLESSFVAGTDGPTIAFLYSCAALEKSSIDCQARLCSAFTRAIAEALEMESGPSGLEALAGVARSRLLSYSDGKQTLTLSGQDGRGGSWRSLVIKVDEAARFRDRLARSTWIKMIEQTELFRFAEARLENFALQIRAIVMRAEESVAEASRTLPIQHWRDETAWKRLLDRLHYVFLASSNVTLLRAEEAAVLLAVPFVYETVLAVAEIRLSNAGAIPNPDAAEGKGHMVAAWRNAWRESDGARVYNALMSRGEREVADDQACWALVDFCHASGELWDPQGGRPQRSGWVLDAVTSLLSAAPFGQVTQDRRIFEVLSTARLLRLARLMFANFDDVTLDATDDTQQLDIDASCGEGASQLTVNEVLLAHLLNLASRLTLDARRLPTLLAEHLGTPDVPSAQALLKYVSSAEWHRRAPMTMAHEQGENWFDLKLDCASDAVDAALLAAVDGLESYRTRLLQRQDSHAAAMRDKLPAGFTANSLNANPSGWHPTRPPLKFELNRTRIIGLLMGENLYGERWPALRELYQNALDACRYRRAQQALAAKEGRTQLGSMYMGRIEFRFGIHERRRFVECVDNGIGMAERHVRRLFAYAGQRFADSHEFHIDRARWEEQNISFHSNSRFGIGVLSYFMLGEELDLVSRRYAPDSSGPAPVRARIIGTGSLFRLESALDLTRLIGDCGSSVRLYLRSDAGEDGALLQSILDWLWLPEVMTVIRFGAQNPIELAAGVPTSAFHLGRGKILLPVPGSEDTMGAARLHIAPDSIRPWEISNNSESSWAEESVGLIDGIATGLRPIGSDEIPNSLIINFVEDFRAAPTVDRRHVFPESKTIEHVWNCVRLNGGAALASWQNPDFTTLHLTLAELGSSVTVKLCKVIQDKEPSTIPLSLPSVELNWPFCGAGVSEIDPTIALELACAKSAEFTHLFIQGRHEADEVLYKLNHVCVKEALEHVTRPIVEAVLFGRLMELIDAGLDAPNLFRLAASYETKDEKHSAPVAIREILFAIERTGRVSLRDVVGWKNQAKEPVLAALRTLSTRHVGILYFDLENVDCLDLQQIKLVQLGVDNRLTNLDLLYFWHTSGLSIEEVKSIARSVQSYGVVMPDNLLESVDGKLTEQQYRILAPHYEKQIIRARRYPRLMDRIVSDARILNMPQVEINDSLAPLEPLMGSPSSVTHTPTGLNRQQLYLLSRDFDGKAPFLETVSLKQIFLAASSGEFKGLEEVVNVARSLSAGEFNRPLVAKFDSSLLVHLSKIIPTSMRFVARIADAIDRNIPVSVWDLVMVVETGKIDLNDVEAILDSVDGLGGTTDRCRGF